MSMFSVNKSNQTIQIIDKFYNESMVIDPSQWEIVYSFFVKNSPNRQVAETFTSLLFNIAQKGQFNVLDLLASIKSVNNRLQMNQLICFYLNSFRSKTALYGVGVIPVPNEPAQRNVVL